MFQRGRMGMGDDEEAKPDLSPMIDCVFILLIFFIITTVFVEETGVQVNRPDVSSSPASLEKNSILIAVTSDSKVIYGGREVGVKGVQSVVKQLLAENEDMNCIIQGDEAARHGIVTQVQDECLSAGVKKEKLTIATE